MDVLTLRPDTLDRMVRAVERVRERPLKASAALRSAGAPYAVAGGNAVAGWVAQRDPAAVRNTNDVAILVRRSDAAAAKDALVSAGFVHVELLGVDVFMDGPDGRPGEGVHLLYAGETVRPDHVLPNPDVAESVESREFRMADLTALVRMKLVSHRLKDRVHLQDMVRVG